MPKPARRLSVASAFFAFAFTLAALLSPAAGARAQSLYNQPRYAAIVVDAASGEVLYARRADQPRYPASITKVMTLYLVFEALATGRLSLNDQVVVSSYAARQPPSKSGLRAGQSLSVDQAIRLAALKSANDIAVALAEKVGGSESRFAALMTLRAQELGMTSTRFVNPHGLPDNRQITTARDIAILSRAIMRDYPQYYSYFSQRSFEFQGLRVNNHNGLLNKMPGVDGIKTGFTNAAGFNLAASGVRDGRRLIAVVLGGSSTAARDENVEDLMNAGFDVLAKRKAGQTITVAAAMREPDDISGPVSRPATEQGSAEQAGLRVVLADAPDRAGADPQGVAWLNSPGASAAGAAGLKATTLALADADRGDVECRKVSRKVKLKATRKHRARTVTRTSTVCKSVEASKTSVAKAATTDCDKAPGKTAAQRRRAKAQCLAEARAETRDEVKTKDKAAGDYRIQVGAFDSRSAAQQHIAKISKRYGGLVAQASSQVQSVKNGAYRARFSGFSAQGAKAACATLSAKGERCMVVAPG